jgi:alpha-galactosidase
LPGDTCTGTPAESWTITDKGALESAGHCLTAAGDHATMKACAETDAQHWNYTLTGNLADANGKCLTAGATSLRIKPCGHNQRNQVWSLPN